MNLDVDCSSVALNSHRLREGDRWLEMWETVLCLGDTHCSHFRGEVSLGLQLTCTWFRKIHRFYLHVCMYARMCNVWVFIYLEIYVK